MDETRKIIRKLLSEDEEHVGDWYHGGRPYLEHSVDQLYVTDELSEAQYYASLTDGIVYRLKDQYHMLVAWALGQSEGIIEQKAAEVNGGFNELFEPLDSVASDRFSENTDLKLRRLEQAAEWLHGNDPDTFEGWCGAVAQVMANAAQQAGMSGVTADEGAVRTPDGDLVDHAWLRVDGQVFDPIRYVMGWEYSEYPDDPSDPDADPYVLCDVLDYPETVETLASILRGESVASDR